MNTIPLWRTKPVNKKLTKQEAFPLKYVFPSGRQAISYTLLHSGLGRNNRVAFPEWSSHCVVSAIAKYCTPIPIKEVVKYRIPIGAMLIYEQWGWPIGEDIIKKIKDYFGEILLIVDAVDSSDWLNRLLHKRNLFKNQALIVSLSKLLGLNGGGLAIYNGQYLTFTPQSISKKINANLGENKFAADDLALVKHLAKSEIACLNNQLQAWIKKNDLNEAIEQERVRRQKNLKILLDHQLSQKWPWWMKQTIEMGAGPTIAPLLRDASDDVLNYIYRLLLKKHKIKTAIYHFNWSGNPLMPRYAKCLALPLHGQMKLNTDILNDIM